MADDVFRIVGTTQAGSFQVQEVVAEGGFAVVYRAYHQAFRASVALKCLKIPGTLNGAAQTQFLERFREEAELLFRLSASIANVVRPLHVGVLDTATGAFAPFIALEWLEGQTLDQFINQRRRDGLAPTSLKRAVKMLSPVAAALDKAHHFPSDGHEISILHRDLKPENVFIATVHGAETLKIVDFGIGKVKTHATAVVGKQSAAEGMSAFTPAYGAPEQWLPKRFGQTGAWTDVWGLALTLVEMALGRPAMDGLDAAALMGSAIDEVRRPTLRAEGVPTSDEVERVLQRALAVDPTQRYPDVARFWYDLESALGVPLTDASRAIDPRSGERRAARVEVMSHQTAPGGLPSDFPPPSLSVPHDPARAATEPPPGGAHRAAETLAAPPSVSSPARPLAKSIPDLLLEKPEPAPSRPAGAPPPRTSSSARLTIARGDPPPPSPATSPQHLFGGTMLDDLGDSQPPPPPDAPVSRPRSGRIGLDVDHGGLPPSGSMRIPRAAATPSVRYPRATPAGSAPSAVDKLKGPAGLVAFAIVLMAADFAYATVTGQSFTLGPLRTVYVAAPLVVIGIVTGVSRLFE